MDAAHAGLLGNDEYRGMAGILAVDFQPALLGENSAWIAHTRCCSHPKCGRMAGAGQLN